MDFWSGCGRFPLSGLVKACVQLDGGNLVLLVVLLARIASGHAYSIWRPAESRVHALRLDGDVALSVPYCWSSRDDGDFLVLHSAHAIFI